MISMLICKALCQCPGIIGNGGNTIMVQCHDTL